MKRLGDAYSEVASATSRARMAGEVSGHLRLVRRIAAHFRGRLPTAIEHADLVQVGIVGLMEAIEAFDKERGSDFETFAKLRIRGAMLDEIRRASWAPRSTVKVAVEARAAAERIANTTGGAVTNRQIAEQLGLDVDRYEKLRGRNQGLAASVTLDDCEFISEAPLPDEVAEEESTHSALARGIAALSDREKLVVAMYYDRELTLREIGAVLEVSESRVSQILTATAKKLRGLIQGDASPANGSGTSGESAASVRNSSRA